MIFALFASVFMVGALLLIVALFLPDFEIHDIASAFSAAGIAYMLEYAAQFVIGLVAPAPSYAPWIAYLLMVVLSTVALAIGILSTPKIRAGLSSALLAAVVVSALTSALTFVIAPLLGGYVPLVGPRG